MTSLKKYCMRPDLRSELLFAEDCRRRVSEDGGCEGEL